jgi:putative spermidine/putrescine transport system substrate-binding protein
MSGKLTTCVLAAVITVLAIPVNLAAAETLTVVASGGVFQENMRDAWWDPVAAKLGLSIAEDTQSKFAELRTNVQSGNTTWDVIALGGYSCEVAGQTGLLEKLDYNVIKTDGVRPEVARDYYIGVDEYQMSIAYSTKKYGENGPKNWADFWDVKKFPGTRAMMSKPNFAFEMALLADGVTPDKLYPLDESRALDKLKALKPNVKVFYGTGGQGTQLMRDDEVDMIAVFSNRANDAIKDGAPYKVEINQSIVDIDCFGIPKGSKHRDAAMKFLAGIVSPEINGRIVDYADVSPINKKSLAAIPDNKKALLTSNPANSSKLVYLNQNYWGPNLDRLSAIYTAAIAN